MAPRTRGRGTDESRSRAERAGSRSHRGVRIRAATGTPGQRARPVERDAAVAQADTQASWPMTRWSSTSTSSSRPAASASAVRWRSSGRRRRVARRVVVDEDDARGVAPDRVPEQLADTDERRARRCRGRPSRRGARRSSCSASRPAAPRARAGPSGGRSRSATSRGERIVQRPAGQSASEPPAELEGGDELRGAGRADARARPPAPASVARARPVRPSNRARASLGEVDRATARGPEPHTRPMSSAASDPPGPRSCEPLARPLGGGSSRMARLAPRLGGGPVKLANGHEVLRGGDGRPRARTTKARRFPPPSGPGDAVSPIERPSPGPHPPLARGSTGGAVVHAKPAPSSLQTR